MGKAHEYAMNHSLAADPPRSWGESEPSPGGRLPPAPGSPSWVLAEKLRPNSPTADVWGGRGAVAMPRAAGWRAGARINAKTCNMHWLRSNERP